MIIYFLLELYVLFCISVRLKFYLTSERFQLTLGVQSHSCWYFSGLHYAIACFQLLFLLCYL